MTTPRKGFGLPSKTAKQLAAQTQRELTKESFDSNLENKAADQQTVEATVTKDDKLPVVKDADLGKVEQSNDHQANDGVGGGLEAGAPAQRDEEASKINADGGVAAPVNTSSQEQPKSTKKEVRRGRKPKPKVEEEDEKRFLRLPAMPYSLASMIAVIEGSTISDTIAGIIMNYGKENYPEFIKRLEKAGKAKSSI